MALARALRQLSTPLAAQLLPCATQSAVYCGLHHQLPSVLVNLADIHAARSLQLPSVLHYHTLACRREQGSGRAHQITASTLFCQPGPDVCM